MRLISDSFKDGEPIPGEFAFAVIDPQHHIALSSNRNPHLKWSEVPSETKSFVLICHDYDVPVDIKDVNKEGHSIPVTQSRDTFFHCILMDIAPTLPESPRAVTAMGLRHTASPVPKLRKTLVTGSTITPSGLPPTKT